MFTVWQRAIDCLSGSVVFPPDISLNFVPQQRILLTFPFVYKSQSASNDVVTFPRKQQ